VSCKGKLADRYLPQVEVSDRFYLDSLYVLEVVKKLVNVDLWGCFFHENQGAALENWECCCADNNRENERANWVGNSISWMVVNNCRGNANSQGKTEITDCVNKGGIDIDVVHTDYLGVVFFVLVLLVFLLLLFWHDFFLGLIQNLELDEIECETHDRGADHDLSFYLLWMESSLDSCVQQACRENQQQNKTAHRSDNLSPVPSVSEISRGLPL